MYLSQATMLPQANPTMTLPDPAWNMDMGASSHLADNTYIKVSVEFDEFGFSVKDYRSRKVLLCCDSSGDLYHVRHQPIPSSSIALLSIRPLRATSPRV
ncbi:hypothetical protein Tco_0891892 [Tanacetum coccineum]|uniref:Uncharacterized protein n=1 Tax=Tanacetum coccineum TaxID=301880 RepID=A0ABQ5C497_9ASTR